MESPSSCPFPVSLLLVLPTSHLGNEVSLSGRTLPNNQRQTSVSHPVQSPPGVRVPDPETCREAGMGGRLPSCGVWTAGSAAGSLPGPRPSGGRWPAHGVEAQRAQTRRRQRDLPSGGQSLAWAGLELCLALLLPPHFRADDLPKKPASHAPSQCLLPENPACDRSVL